RKYYSAEDNSPEALSSIVFYRIKETDLNGSEYYSAIVKLSGKAKTAFSIYPNPISDKFVINGYASQTDNLSLRILNAEGRIIQQERWNQSAGSYVRQINFAKYPSGIYLVEVTGIDGTQKSKLMKK